jgi:putative FmdB family regulatory protein
VPTYVFRCSQCRLRFEELLSVNEVPPGCPKCGAALVRRVASAAGLLRPDRQSAHGGPVETMRDVGAWAQSHLDRFGMGRDPEISEIIERGRTGDLVRQTREQLGV